MENLTVMLVIYAIACTALLLAFWAYIEVKDIKSNEKQVRFLTKTNHELEQRIAGMERVMMRNGYRPPHKQ